MTMGSHIVAGPTNTVVVDKQCMYWMAGKVRRRSPDRVLQLYTFLTTVQWKNSGEGKPESHAPLPDQPMLS